MMRISAVRLEVETANGPYGFEAVFSDGLNIIRGNNTSGKSTLVNAIIYSLGMEELLGSVNESALPYALRTSLLDTERSKECPIVSSTVLTQLKNSGSATITLRRPIVSSSKDTKLIEVIQGPFLTEPKDSYKVVPTYVHDPGSARSEEAGFYRYLENFLGFDLPFVPNSLGGETKLYLQTVFAAFFIEQKSGWTDYIANIPYFRIRNAAQKVFEFIVGLDVFENERLRNEIRTSIKKLAESWSEEIFRLSSDSIKCGVQTKGIPRQLDSEFRGELVLSERQDGDEIVGVPDYLGRMRQRLKEIESAYRQKRQGTVVAANLDQYQSALAEISRLTLLFRATDNDIRINSQSIEELLASLSTMKKDVERNNAILKLKKLGYELGMDIAKDVCPTCHQHVSDSLIQSDDQYVMSVEQNVVYLNSQVRMIERHCNAKKELVERSEALKAKVRLEIERQDAIVQSIRRGVVEAEDATAEVAIRQRVNLENEISQLDEFLVLIDKSKEVLSHMAQNYLELKERESALPKEYLSEADRARLRSFEETFKKLAKEFDFRSTAVENIVIDEEKYVPLISGDVIKRDLRGSLYLDRTQSSKLRNDASASDFVRLIWSYALSLFIVSEQHSGGHHPGVIVLDEPGQHSMAVESLRALLIVLGKVPNLQSIVAASFDESEDVFSEATRGVRYSIVDVMPKVLRPRGR